ncbi:MAG: hypothetical protein WC544_01085 [Patescibacteria group bacterium]
MKSRGFIHIAVIIVITLVAALMVGAAWFYHVRSETQRNRICCGDSNNANSANANATNTVVNNVNRAVEDEQTYTYSSAYRDFSFVLPTDWIVEKSPDNNAERQGLLTAYDPNDSPGTAYFTSTFYNNAGSFTDWIPEHMQELIQGHEDINDEQSDYSDPQRQIIIGEMKGLFTHAHCFVQSDKIVYELYFFSELANWPKYRDTFFSACRSFTVNSVVDTSDWLTYTDNKLGFFINHPSSWQIDTHRSNSTTVVFTTTLSKGEGRESIQASTTDQSLEAWQAGFDPTTVIDTSQTTVSGQKAIRVNTSEFSIDYVAVRNGTRLYVFTSNGGTNGMFGNGMLKTFTFLPDTSDWQTYTNEMLGIKFQYPNGLKIGKPNPGLNADPNTSPTLWEYIVIPIGNGSISLTQKKDYYGIYEAAYSNTFYSKVIDFTASLDSIRSQLDEHFNEILDIEKNEVNGVILIEFYELGLYGDYAGLVYRVLVKNDKYINALGTYAIETGKYPSIGFDHSRLEEVKNIALQDVENTKRMVGDYKEKGENILTFKEVVASFE